MPSLPKDGSCSESGFSLSRRAIYQSHLGGRLEEGEKASKGMWQEGNEWHSLELGSVAIL